MNMDANKESPSLSNRMIRTFFLVFFLQQFSNNSPKVVDAAYFDFQQSKDLPSCKDHGIFAGDSGEIDCTAYCNPNYFPEYFDSVSLVEDPKFAVRNTVCRCYESGQSRDAPRRKAFECWTKAEVWDKSKPLLKCEEDYGILSMTTCKDYCKNIDPKAFSFDGFAGSANCGCGGFEVCSDKPVASASSTISVNTVSAVLTVMVGSLMTLWS